MIRSVYFSEEELKCPCCNKNLMEPHFLSMLDNLRVEVGIPLVLNSAYRCPSHNTAVGGVPNSAHVAGLAVDIRATTGTMKYKVIVAAFKVGFVRVGVGKGFIHVDNDQYLPQRTVWTY